MKRPTFLIAFLYAVVVIMLGIMGYRAGSLASLIASLTSGILIIALLIIAIVLKKRWPVFFVLIATVALLSVFIFRFSSTKNFMPAVMAVYSGLVAILTTIWLASKKNV